MKPSDIAALAVGTVAFGLIAAVLYFAFAEALPWVVEVMEMNGVKLP